MGDAPVLLDPAEDTWARLDLDPLTREALPSLLPRMTDPLQRAATWNAVRNGLHNALLGTREVQRLLVACLPGEPHEAGLHELLRVGDRVVAWSAEPSTTAARLHEALRDGLRHASTGSGRQLALFRGAVATADDVALLRAWLRSRSLPDGLEVDRDLRWRLRTRLAVVGATDADELDGWLVDDPDAASKVDHARARASLPDADAKAWAWTRFRGEGAVPNYELLATGDGFWRHGQETLTDGYVRRYLDEVTDLPSLFQGWLMPDVAGAFFPGTRVDTTFADEVAEVVGRPDLEASLRRRLVEQLDLVRRAVEVRQHD